VTIPHKETVLKHALHQEALVMAIGAANTLSFESAGVKAFNTDAAAAVESLKAAIQEQEVEEVADDDRPRKGEGFGLKTALVLGAGGAARAVAFGLKQQGVDVTVTSRTLERSKRIATEVGCRSIDWTTRYRVPHDCVVNATPIGMHPNVDETPYAKEYLRSYMVVFDTVYNPENTLLVKEARAVGCRIVTGVDMFVRQAAIQFRIWHGADAPDQVMRDALKRATSSARQPD
jgi:3-dehydroquinate dehydratase/shikimate dehydrogenase